MAITLQCIAVDDENLALQLLQAYVTQTEGLHLVAGVTNASELPTLLQQHPIDILFLDIQMPVVNGLQLAEQLENGPMIVFVTAYANHAAEGFRLNAVDYLLKPYSYDRFLQAIAKCRDYHEYKQLKKRQQLPDCMYVKADGRMVKVLFDDILFIEGRKQYVQIVTGSQKVLTLDSMKHMEVALPPDRFARVHKSFIVAVNKVTAVGNDALYIGHTVIPVGRSYKHVKIVP